MRLQISVCLLRVISPYSNGSVQIRVGLEPAEKVLEGCSAGCSSSSFVLRSWACMLAFLILEIEKMFKGNLKRRGVVGGQTRVDLATLACFPCFIGFGGPVNGVNLIKTL